ncbi:hypothetical protein ATERTT37_004079 [Aspergillus terreus]
MTAWRKHKGNPTPSRDAEKPTAPTARATCLNSVRTASTTASDKTASTPTTWLSMRGPQSPSQTVRSTLTRACVAKLTTIAAVSSAAAAVATDAVNTAYHGITRRAEVKKSETVFLFGLGGLGFNALQIVQSIGARVIVSDLRQEKLDAAAEKGVPQMDIVPREISIPEFVSQHGLEGKIDTVLDFAGTNQTFRDAQQIVRRGGKILCVGTLDRKNELDMKIGIRKRLSIIFSYGGQYDDLVEVLDLIAKGVIQPQVETKGLLEFPQVLKDLCDGKIKDRVALTCQ